MLATGTFDLLARNSTSLCPLCEAASNAALATISIYCDLESTYLNFVVEVLSMLKSVLNFNDSAYRRCCLKLCVAHCIF